MSLNMFLPDLYSCFTFYTRWAFSVLDIVNSQIIKTWQKPALRGNTYLTAIRLAVFCNAHWCMRGSWPLTCCTAAPARCLCVHQSFLSP